MNTPKRQKTEDRVVRRGRTALPVPRASTKYFCASSTRTVESALGTEYAQAQENLQRQYLTQVQGLHNELQTAQRQFSEQLSQERTAKNQEMEALRRELAGKAQLAREQANDLQQNARMHREMHENEEARVHETLAAQAEQMENPLRCIDSAVRRRNGIIC